MSDEYTPTTDEVKQAYVYGMRLAFIASDGEYAAEFDRWLTEYTRVKQAEAWEAAIGSMRYEDGSPVEVVSTVNPYRKGKNDD